MAAAANGPSLLPDDVFVTEILPRLPPRAIGAFRAVCKAWKAIASSPTADRVLANKRRPAAAVTAVVTRDARRLEVDEDGRRPVDIVRFDFFRGRWHPDVHNNKEPCPRAVSLDGMDINAKAFRSWDGVLCTRVSPRNPPLTGAGADKYMLWNPVNNACAVVSAPAAAGQGGRIIGGYAHPVTGRFHLLHSSDVAVPGGHGLLVAPTTVRLLAVGDGAAGWREVPLPESSKTTTIAMRGKGDRSVSLHGNLHWLVQQQPASGKEEAVAAAALLVFDTVREEFRLIASPELRPELDPTTACSRVVPGGKLCVLAFAQQPPPALEVWVLDDYSDTRRSWRLRETVRLDVATGLHSPRRFAAVEVVEGAHEGEEIFIQLGRTIFTYSVRGKAWRQVSVAQSCAALLLYRESVLQPEICFGKALCGFRRGSVLSRRSRGGRFRRRSYSYFGIPASES